MTPTAPPAPEIIDDLSGPFPRAACGGDWAMVADRVMGGVSTGALAIAVVGGRRALRLTGEVRLENDGGFVQMALDLAPGGGVVDASGWAGLEIEVAGPPESYGLHLRTDAATRPWQSWRAGFRTAPEWRRLRLTWDAFAPHRIDRPFDPARLRRLGLVAIGRPFRADLAVAGLRFFA